MLAIHWSYLQMLIPPNQRVLGKFRPCDCGLGSIGLMESWSWTFYQSLQMEEIPYIIFQDPAGWQFRQTMKRAQGHFHITVFFFYESFYLPNSVLMFIFSMYESLCIFLYFLSCAHHSSYIIIFHSHHVHTLVKSSPLHCIEGLSMTETCRFSSLVSLYSIIWLYHS